MPSVINNLQSQDIIALIVGGLDAPPAGYVEALSNRVDSDRDSEKYVWLGSAPNMRQWIGGRQPKTIRENNYSVPNKDFEATLEIPTDWLRRDKTGQIQMKISQLVERANTHDAQLLSALINAADGLPCYDGQYFFDTDHQEGDSATQSNSITYDSVSTTAPTAGEMGDAILAAVQAMYGLKDDQNEPINGSAKNFTVMVPVPFMRAAAAALGSDILLVGGQSTTNSIKAVGSIGGLGFSLEVNPRLTWTTKFAVFRSDAVLKPFVKQVEVDTQVSALAEGSEEEFKNKRHLYGVNRTMNFGLSVWQGAMLTTFT
jgi:phage major head subunit gpT-like protein